MRLFLDTEFTDFRDPRLLSVGLVAEDGREFYAEVTDGWEKAHCNAFVVDSVLPHLGAAPASHVSRAELKQRMIDWLESLGPAPVITQIVFDSEVDWRVLREACGNLNTAKLDVQWTWLTLPDADKRSRCEALIEEYFVANGPRHHALVDARALRSAVLEIESAARAGERSGWQQTNK